MKTQNQKMNAPQQEPIVLKVLRVASPDVLGQTKPLSIATPFCFSNASGHLKTVDSYAQIRKMAAESATSFKASMK